ncbi:hypothetical protein R6Q57_019007 [Mikania cordata]
MYLIRERSTGNESVTHLFSSGYVAAMICHAISTWCGLPPIYVFSVNDLLEIHRFGYCSQKKKKGVEWGDINNRLVYLEQHK